MRARIRTRLRIRINTGYWRKSKKKSRRTNMADLESKESAEQRRNQRGQGIQKLAPNQMLSRLPIFVTQIKQETIQKNLKIK